MARITHNGKLRFLGLFDTLREAGLAYDKAAYEQWGEFSRLNFELGGQ